MKRVRTRFAPSPTGFQHVGGFRTAIYAWLLAKHFGGDFILRVEDTDQARSVPGAIKYLIESLSWLGITCDEGPTHEDLKAVGEYWDGAPDIGGMAGNYIQSQRLKYYEETAEKLIELGVAYRCDCTSEMLEKERNEQMARRETPGYSGYCRTRNVSKDSKHVIRLKIPGKVSLSINDAVRGVINWENPPLRDPVLLKSDKFPTYHLACVVDDHMMEVSHVLRGDEWIATTPIHVMLYEALGWEQPIFCHLSHILGPDGKKLSKRHGANSLDIYRNEGYLAQAILNFIVLIGWNPGEGETKEIFSIPELIERFSLEHLSNTSGIFDLNKLNWMNGNYIRLLPLNEFIELGKPYLSEKYEINEKWNLIAPHVQERVKLITELPEMVEFVFKEVDYSNEDLLSGNDSEAVKSVLVLALEKLKKLPDFTLAEVEAAIRTIPKELSIKPAVVFMPIRIATTGRKITPPLFESITVLGKEVTTARLEKAIAKL